MCAGYRVGKTMVLFAVVSLFTSNNPDSVQRSTQFHSDQCNVACVGFGEGPQIRTWW